MATEKAKKGDDAGDGQDPRQERLERLRALTSAQVEDAAKVFQMWLRQQQEQESAKRR